MNGEADTAAAAADTTRALGQFPLAFSAASAGQKNIAHKHLRSLPKAISSSDSDQGLFTPTRFSVSGAKRFQRRSMDGMLIFEKS